MIPSEKFTPSTLHVDKLVAPTPARAPRSVTWAGVAFWSPTILGSLTWAWVGDWRTAVTGAGLGVIASLALSVRAHRSEP